MIFLRTFFAVFILLFSTGSLFSQVVIFSEDFEPMAGPEYNGATTGTSAEGYTWNTNCPSCTPPADIFETLNGQLRGADTNGPAFFTVNGIDATGCFVLTFQFDYSAAFGYNGSGNLECVSECPPAGGDPCSGDPDDATSPGCNTCWDFLSWEINSGSITDENVVLGLDCNDGATGSVESDPLCLDQPGADPSDVNLVITMSMWASDEWMQVDNITILCYTEIEANNEGLPIPAGCGGGCTIDIDDVIITEPTCNTGDDGSIEIDATGLGLSGSLEYSIDGGSNFEPTNTFNNLTAGTYDIVVQDDNDPSCFATITVMIDEPAPLMIGTPSPLIICYSLLPPGGEILNLDIILDELTNFDPTLDVNLFFDMDGNDPLDPTDPGDIITLVINLQTTIFASVSDGTCESNIVPVSIDLNEYPDPDDAMLTECPDASGDVTFTPSDANGDITAGAPGLTVTYHTTPTDAENGDSPILGDVVTSTNQTLYASVQNSAGCIAVAELELIVSSSITAEDASLEVCDDGTGQGDFDLTEAETTILNGQGGTVIFYEDVGLNDEIFTPTSYVSGPGVIYAVIDDGSGCISAPSEVTLSLITIDPDDLSLSFDPSSACGSAIVAVTINTPSDPPGDYIFDVSYGPLSTGINNNIILIGMDGATNFNLGISESHIFVINSVTGPGPSNCVVTFAPPEEYIIDITDGPDAFPVDITVCANAAGDGVFDLTSAIDEINDFSGNAVDFYEDDQLNDFINNPSMYTSGSTTVYAVVDDGNGCSSDPVEVTLIVELAPDPVDLAIDITSSCGEETVTLTFSLPGGESFDLNLITTDGSGSSSTLLTNVDNNDQQSFTVNETTTFTIDEVTTSSGCVFDLAPTPSVTITIDSGFMPSEASLDACDSGNGDAIFDLTDADVTVNGNSGNTVLWFTDMDGTDPIGNPSNYPSGGGIVYAAVDNGICISETVEVTLTVFDLPTATIQVDQVISCASASDGAISVNVTGPMAYTFDWNDNTYDGQQVLTNLNAGFYALTLTDGNGCEAFADINLIDPSALDLTCNVVNDETTAGANDGAMSFDISGGTPTYDASLSGPTNATLTDLAAGTFNFDNLAPGNYTLTITDDNDCQTDCTFTIQGVVCDLSLTLTGNDPLCAGASDGTLNLEITGGQAITSIDWNVDALDGLSMIDGVLAGTYTVTVTDDNDCSEMASITLTDPADYTFNCTATILPSGPGAMDGALSVIITDGPGGPYTVSYDNGAGSSGMITEAPMNSFTQNGLPPGIYQISITNAADCTASCSVDLEVPPCPLDLDQAITPPTCSDASNGMITVTPTDGTPTYSFDWSDDTFDGSATATGLSPGAALSVTVTDAVGCEDILNFIVPTPPAVVVDCSMITNPSNAMATDGSIDLVVSSGVAPYTISWAGPVNGSSNLASAGNLLIENLSVGNYTITVEDDNGCTTTCMTNLTAAACDLTLDLQGDNPDCAQAATGSLELTIDSSFPITSIGWNVDALDGTEDPQSLVAGIYAVTVTDNAGCTATADLTLVDPPAIFIDCSQTTNPTSPTNADGNVVVNVAGGNFPYMISWDGPVTGMTTVNTPGSFTIMDLSVGAYTITVEDQSGCQESCGFVMINNDNCDFSIALSGTDPTCNGDMDGIINIELIDGQADYTFTWNDSDLDSQGPDGNQAGLSAGDYSVTVVDDNNCAASGTFTLNEPDAILFTCATTTHPSSGTATDGVIAIDFTSGPGGPYTLTYNNGAGAMGSIPIVPGMTTIDNLPEGNYTITIENGTCSATCSTDLIDSSCTFDLSIDVTPELCEGANDGTATALPLGGTDPYIYAWSNMGDTQQITDLPDGDYMVTVTDAAGCVASATTTVLPGQALPTVVSGAGAAICADSCYLLPLNFTGTAPFNLTYEINTSSSTLIFLATFNNLEDSILLCPAIAGIPSGDFTVELLTLTDATCENSLNDLTPFTYLPPAIGMFNPTICLEDSVQVGDEFFSVGNPNGQVVLQGEANSGCDSTVVVNIGFYAPSTLLIEEDICTDDTLFYGGVAFFSNHLNDVIVLENESSNGCDSTITVNLTLIQGGANPMNPLLCAGDTIIIAGEIFDQNRPFDIIELPNQSANGCDSLIIVTLDIIPLIATPVDLSICQGDSIMVGDSTLTVAGNYDILLPNASANGCDSLVAVTLEVIPLVATPVDLLICSGDSITVGDSLLTMVGSYDILLPDAGLNGCDSLVTVTLDFFPPAESLLNGIFCNGEEVMVGDSLFTADNADGTVLLPGASSNGCDSTIVVEFIFLPGATSDLDTLLCFGGSLTLAGQTFDVDNPGGIVILEDAAANGCDSTIFVTTTYLPELFASVGPDTLVCGDQVLDAVVNLSPGAFYDFSVQISPGFLLEVDDVMGGEYTFGLGTINSDITLELVEVTSSNGCPVTIENGFATIRYSDTQLTLNSTGGTGTSDLSCANSQDGSIVSQLTGGVGPFVFQWDNGETSSSLTNLGPGTYTLTVTDAPGCSVEETITFVAPPPLEVTAEGISAGCFGETTGSVVIDTVFGGTGPYEYSLDNEFFASLVDFPNLVPGLAAGAYTVYIQDANDCQASLNIAVPVGVQLDLDLGADHTIQAGDSILLDPNYFFEAASWVWTPPTGLSNPDSTITHAAPLETTIYQLQITDPNGCSASDIVRIFVENNINIYVPNAFSPNGDGTNDQLMIFAGTGVEMIESFIIFDRWGEQVHQTGPFLPNDPNFSWDGKLNGEVMNPAVFVYLAQVRLATGEVVVVEGDFVLLK